MNLRSFLCIELKKPEILKEILKFQDEINQIKMKMKFVESENIHLTLKFLGEIDKSLVGKIYDIMKEVSFSSFNLILQGVGSFPINRPRVVWIGLTEGQNEVLSIMNYLNQKLKQLGFKPEKRKPSVHLTVGRVKYVEDKKAFMDTLQKWKNHLFGKIEIDSFQFKESKLTPKGPIYTTLKEIQV